MKWSKWLEQWHMTPLKTKTPFLDMELKPQDEDQCELFRQELNELQQVLRTYTKMLASMAGVEDLTELEKE